MAEVSVVIPAFNPGEFLGRALSSVLAQTLHSIECIVVDDGSTEDLTALAGHDDSRVRYLRQPNMGVSAARNRGVSVATAAFVAFLDQDDEWHPEKLELQLDRMRAADANAFCYTGFEWNRSGRGEVAGEQQVSYHGLLRSQHVCLSSVVVRRSAYLLVGGHDPLLRVMQDYDLFLRLSRIAEPVGVARPLVRYNLHDSNVSADYATAARERFRLIASHRDVALRVGDTATVKACDAGVQRTRELFGLQALEAARAAHRSSDRRSTALHLARAARLTRGRAAIALAPALQTRIRGGPAN
ncbi:glycosyltransferase family A protein [Yimella sp. cx-51]|uniref:glycosyltransferase family 2 protein n=1 Tax=Yimella sp. cx-51 TaxID=2770551 RepID=UPI00165D32BF|nr:glycosyltransferase family A protein [Yimella sp. cx-51]MBC9958198.1 glycosyltransferase family 2 protein [Yimella sp. cx-51]QTH38768.1 glycosyltransferase family 2 protein [Yimella sp. cx-51]